MVGGARPRRWAKILCRKSSRSAQKRTQRRSAPCSTEGNSLRKAGSDRHHSRPPSCGTSSCPYCQAKTVRGEDRRERVEAGITALRESSIERFPGKTCLACERSHTAHRFGYSSKRDRHGASITILEHRFNVGGDLGLALQVIRRSERTAWVYGLCSLSSTHELVRYPSLAIAYRHRTGG